MRNSGAAEARVAELLGRFASPRVCVARLLCDDRDPESAAFVIVRTDLSREILRFGELRAESERFAAGLAGIGVGPGDRVATLLGKSRHLLCAMMGIWRLGAVCVPLFTAFAPPAIAVRLKGSAAKAVVCDGNQQAKLASDECAMPEGCRVITTAGKDASLSGAVGYEELVGSAPEGYPPFVAGGDGAFVQIYTSGTAGNPKGVVIPVRALASFQAYAEFGLDLRPEDVFWNAADPGWAYGLYFGILATLTTGVAGILYEGGFSPEATMAILERYQVTNFAAAPTVYRALRASGVTPSRALNLRCASSAGEPLTPNVNEWALAVLAVEVHDHYGQSETGMLINNHHHPSLARPLVRGSMGQVMPGWSAAILESDCDEPAAVGDVGRVAMDLDASPLAWFTGYFGDPARTMERFSTCGRWYVTGDTGRMDADANFYFACRDDDVIIMAGYRIGPSEVESVLLGHPAVAECAVVSLPDEIRGEVLEAAIVLRPGRVATEDLAKELQVWVKTRYAAHAYPRQVHYWDQLPRTPSGKVQRFVIRQQLSRERSRPGPRT
jgi:acetyl-CoA synthetase